MFQTQASQELYDTQMQLNACKMVEGQSVSSQVLKIKSYVDKLECLGHPLPHVLAVNIVLGSLPKLFDNFFMNYNMQGWDNKSLGELHSMLKTAEKNVSSKSVVSSLHMIREGGVNKKVLPLCKDSTLEEELSLLPCYRIHIPNNVQGMINSKRLENGAMVLHMGNRNQAKVEAIRTYFLNVPSDMELCLEQCHYTHTITRGVISISCLRDAGFELCVCGKMTKNPFYGTWNWADDLLGLIHTDVCGPFRVPTQDGDTYFITFIDDFSRYGYGYALETIARILNMLPTKRVDKTPYKIWHGKAPRLFYLRVWGCDVLVKCATPNKQKPALSNFLESDYLLQEFSGSDEILNEVRDTPTKQQTEEPSSSSIILHDSELVKEEVIPTNVVVEQAPPKNLENVIQKIVILEIDEPDTYNQAIYGSESSKWLESINVEMQSMKDNKVWDLVDSPLGAKVVGCKWAFKKKKTDMDGNLNTFKAGLVVKEWCVYIRTDRKKVVFLILYVDNIFIMGNDVPMLEGVKAWLRKCFAIKDLGEAAYILGIKIYRDRSKQILGLCQSTYIDKILNKFKMENSKRGWVSMTVKKYLSDA
ncbi:retrotransposon protein, putative, ty1-copia subclass [Tanacetum coccineum]